MRGLRRRSALVVGLAALALPAAASAEDAGSVSASSGAVQATLSWQAAQYGVSDPHLTVVRAGATAFDDSPVAGSQDCAQLCSFPTLDNRPPLSVVDLDGDGEPEVLVDAFTGGAHCCSITEILRFNGTGYDLAEAGWGDPGYRLADLDRDGKPEFVSADDAFAYVFASYAMSWMPPKVFQWRAGAFTIVTKQYPALVKRDLVRLRKALRSAQRHHYETTGLIAGYTADLYLLGRAREARRYLAHAHGGRPFKRRLLSFLHKQGYR